MKRLIPLIMALCLLFCSCAAPDTNPEQQTQLNDASSGAQSDKEDKPQGSEPQAQTELIVFAAASMTETLQNIQQLYKERAGNVSIIFNFDSSGTLKTQIEEGAPCDLFISAAQKQMNELDISSSANSAGLDYVLSQSRVDLLENKVVLCVSEDNGAGIKSFDDLSSKLMNESILMAMGNSDVPVGQYTQKILAYYQLNEQDIANMGKITYGSNVKEVTTQIAEGSVDCGVVYCTDAFSAGLTIVDYAAEDMCGRVVYPAAVMKNSAHQKEAQDFLDFLLSADAMRVFESVGFSPA